MASDWSPDSGTDAFFVVEFFKDGEWLPLWNFFGISAFQTKAQAEREIENTISTLNPNIKLRASAYKLVPVGGDHE